jgi:hypothetical protein
MERTVLILGAETDQSLICAIDDDDENMSKD